MGCFDAFLSGEESPICCLEVDLPVLLTYDLLNKGVPLLKLLRDFLTGCSLIVSSVNFGALLTGNLLVLPILGTCGEMSY